MAWVQHAGATCGAACPGLIATPTHRYTFIYWLPLYLSHINYTTDEAGRLSTFFDLGALAAAQCGGSPPALLV